MRRADLASGLFWLAAGLAVAWAGWDLELGALSDPGSGFLVFWMGVIIAGLAAIVLVQALRRVPTGETLAARWAGVRWFKVVVVVALLAAYAWALPRVGFVAGTAVLLVLLFKAVEPQRWWVATVAAAATTLIADLVFRVWLGAQLPAGTLWGG